MTNSYDVDHGLSQCPPGPLEPVEIAQQDDTLSRTGNTARDQEMYTAGIRTGEENAKHNAAIRASMPDGWELVTRKTCYALMHDGAVIATLAGPESETNAAIIARMLAAPVVSTVEDEQDFDAWLYLDQTQREPGDMNKAEIELAREAFSAGRRKAAPAAGDALDAARYRWLRNEVLVDGEVNDSLYVHVDSPEWPTRWALVGDELDTALDAAIAAQRKGDA